MLKILFLSNAKSIHTVRWVNALAERGHDVHLAFKRDDSPTENIISNKVILHSLKYSGTKAYFINAPELNILYKEIKPDIVNVHYASGYGTLARLAKLRPLILSVWGGDIYDFPYQGKLKNYILKKNLQYADKIASTSFSMARQVEKVIGEERSIAITPFGVNVEVFKHVGVKKNNNTIVFGVVKALDEKYGIEYIIKGFKLLLDQMKNEGSTLDTKLVIYGRGPLEAKLKTLCQKLSIADTVTFEGYILNTEVPNALNKMDVFCLGSILDSESFGVALVEAMACEIPVIATDVSGFKEVMIDGVTGFIVPRKNEYAIAEKMYELLHNKDMRIKMGKNGRKRVIAEYSWDYNVESMIELYRDIAMRKSK